MKKQVVLVIALAGMLALGGALLAQDKLDVKQMVLCKKITDRNPVDVAETFAATDVNIYCFVALANPGAETTVTFKWFFNGKEHYKQDSKIGRSANWRTNSAVGARVGEWTVQLFAGETMLKELAFKVQ
jgi:hypothetical protein